MRRRSTRLPVAIFVVLCTFVALLVTGIVLANNVLAPYDPHDSDEMSQIPVPLTPTPSPSPAPEPTLEPEPPVDAALPDFFAPDEERQITEIPARMRIPALSLDYGIKSMGADEYGTMQVAPGIEVVSWFDRSAIPGNEGNAIFGAHNSWSGVRSKVYKLDELEIGDELEIEYEDGTCLVFLLESVFVYELRTAPAQLIMDTEGEARLTLITCKAPFNTVTGTSDNRIVAIFKEESVFVYPDPPVMKFPPKENE